MELLFYLAISLLFNYLILTIAYLRQSDKYTDLAYALTFITLIITAYIKSGKLTILGFVNIFLVFIWAFRLGSFLLLRISKIKKDERFNNIRKNFLKFFAFFTIQALTVWVVLFSTFVIAKNQGMIVPKSIPFVIICILSLILEHQSDMQKFIWKAKGGRGLIKNGWYSMCRYPNYLGEMSFWTSLSILAIFNLKTFNIYYVILSLLSPLWIILLIRYVSGIKILENKRDALYKDDHSYWKYKKEINMLFPSFKKYKPFKIENKKD